MMIMKKLLFTSLISSTIFFGANSAKADWDYWAVKTPPKGDGNGDGIADTNFWDLYTINSSRESATFIKRFCMNDNESCATNFGYPIWNKVDYSINDKNHSIDKNTIILKVKDADSGTYKQYKYSLSGGTFSRGEEVTVSPTDETLGIAPEEVAQWYDSYSYYGNRENNAIIREYGNVNARFGETIISQEGVIIDGDPLITKKDNGEIHIGKNSLITKEEDGVQKLYAQDENGNAINIDVSKGTKLLINGRDVEQSINNVGALSAALTGLPTVPSDTTLACGLGTGTHGGDFAFSGGCASRLNEKLSINYAASTIMPGQDYVGDFEDTFSARAGFVWKLGKSIKPTQISINQKKDMDLKISKLEKNNEELKTKNNEIISQNAKLLERLEKLENIAFKFQTNAEIKLSKEFQE